MGIVLFILGCAVAAMLVSYTPEDPSWMSATDAAVQNWMGRLGAALAAPLFMIVGWGSWGIAVGLAGWGMRFAFHIGEDRVIPRAIFAPIWIAFGAIYASTLLPVAGWTHSFGMGGLFGDTVLATALTILPLGEGFWLKLISGAMGFGIVAMGAFVLGFTKVEVKRIARFLLIGVIMTYAAIMSLLGRGTSGALRAAKSLQEAQAARREKRNAEQAEAAAWAESHYDTEAYASDEDVGERGSFLSRMPALIKRPEALPEPELIETDPPEFDAEAPGEERIREKIADVIKSRVRKNPAIQVETAAPLTKGPGSRT